MKPEEKVEALNKAVNGSLSITHYSAWELCSYGKDSLFKLGSGNVVSAKSFIEVIERAYKRLTKYERRK